MPLDFDTLQALRQNHPAWQLLRAQHAPLITSFLERLFILTNRRVIAEPDLVEALEDELFERRQTLGDDAFPKPAIEYLSDWAATEHGWLRRFYPDDTDEPAFDLSPSTEKAIAWLNTLMSRKFVGTESRLLTLFELLRQISEGTDTDPVSRRAELERKRNELDAQIAEIDKGHLPLLEDTAIRDRFQQFTALARELLTDFREVEENFRHLDRHVRERIARWEGSKGELLAEILGERDAISNTDQGRSFQAFWGFLMSSDRQIELGTLLERVLSLPAVQELQPERRLRRVHHDWLEAGEHTQRTVATLSQQLRQFLDDQAWLENRRIMDIIKQVESLALDVRANPPAGKFTDIADTRPRLDLPMERPLHVPVVKPQINSDVLEGSSDDADTSNLFSQIVIDREALTRHARSALQQGEQISLGELIKTRPLEHGLAELVTWLQLADSEFHTVTDDEVLDTIFWQVTNDAGTSRQRQAQLPRILFVR